MWRDILDSFNDVFSPPFRGAMLKSVGLTLATLALGGVAAADMPATDSRGVETMFDGKIFDPADPTAYLKSLAIKRIA